ncbi:PAS domain S-box protein, partial [bacterium]|nr:PAS domain S-box protein [bacterium]
GRVQAELQTTETNYRELVEGVSSIVLRMDTQGNLTFANRFTYSFFGYSPEEILGKNVVGTIVPRFESRGRDMAELIRDICEHPERYECNENENVRRDGTRVWIAWTNRAAQDENGQMTEILCIGNDITDRKRSEEALRASEKSCHDILDASSDTVLIHDLEHGVILDANRAVFDMYGYTPEDVLGLTVEDLSLGEPPYRQADAEPLWHKAIAEGPQRFEWRSKKKSGELFWSEVILQRVVISGRERILALVRDITQRRTAEQKIREEQQMLRQLLESQERERRLIGFEIHDGLAQQLAGAIMQFQAFDQLRESDVDAALESLRAGQHMLDEALVETRRLIGGLRPLVLDESGVVAAIENLVAETEARGGPKVEFSANVQFVRLDPRLESSLFRMVQESLANAARHSGSDAARIELVEEADQLRLRVQDSGAGFDPATVGEKCFGLAGIRERAELLGGHAEIQSSVGKGTRVSVTLPLIPAPDERGG